MSEAASLPGGARRYEGTSLEDALARAQADLGSDARVLEANHVRRGGVGGFFAREWVEVIAAPAERPATDVQPTQSVQPVQPARIERLESAAKGTAPVESVLDLADRMNAIERTVHRPVPTEAEAGDGSAPIGVSTELEEFQAVLARVAASVNELSSSLPSATNVDVAARSEATVDHEVTVVTAPPAPPAPTASPPTPRAPRIHTTRRVPPRAPRVERRERAAALARSSTSVSASLVALGVPERLVPHDFEAIGLRNALAESLVGLPGVVPLPTTRGVVIAVVGNGSAPVDLAVRLLEEQGLPSDALVVASPGELPGVPVWLQIDDGAAAAERRQSWRRRERATVVAVPCVGPNGPAFARDVLDNLEPTLVWGVVEAYRKPEDVSEWCERLGGVDALALVGLRDTASPAAVMRTGIAIGRVDGEPATPLHWADLLTERLT